MLVPLLLTPFAALGPLQNLKYMCSQQHHGLPGCLLKKTANFLNNSANWRKARSKATINYRSIRDSTFTTTVWEEDEF